MMRKLRWFALCAALLGPLSGCSLLTIKSPERPLSTRDLNTRMLTRAYSAHFIAEVGRSADRITEETSDPDVRLNALRWRTTASGESVESASQMAPKISLLDSWALSVQMAAFVSTGDGRLLCGSKQPIAVTSAALLSHDAEELGRQLLPADEFARDRAFVQSYAETNPIPTLQFARPSVLDAWARESGADAKLVDSLGTVSEALADVGDRLRMYGAAAPDQVLWRAQLAMQQTGFKTEDVRDALKRLDQRVAELTTLANSAPRLASGMVHDASNRFDSSWAEVVCDVHAEAAILSANISTEREAALISLDAQRAALAADAQHISAQVIRETGEEVRRLVRDALIGIIVLVVVLLGLPFAAGYWVGRARRVKASG